MANNKYADYLKPRSGLAGEQIDFGAASPDWGGPSEYPSADQYNVFPTLYLPRVYGKDLSAFEIASSGKIAITINDVHSFDLSRNNDTSNVSLTTSSNDSFSLSAGQNLLFMDGMNSNTALYSACNILIAASNALDLNAGLLNWNIQGDINFNAASNIIFSASNGMVLTAKNSNIELYTACNLILDADSNVNISGYNLSQTFLGAATSTVSGAASFVYGGLYTMSAGDHVSMTSSSNMTLSASNLFLDATNDATFTIGGSMSNIVGLDMDLAAQQRVHIHSAASNVDIASALDTTIAATGAVRISGASLAETIAGAASVVVGGALSIAASNEVELKSAESNLSLWAASNMDIYAGKDATFTIAGAYGEMVSGAASLLYGGLYTLSASNDVSFASQSNLTIASFCNLTLDANKDATIDVAGSMSNIVGLDMDLGAQQRVYIHSAASNVDLVAFKDVTTSAVNIASTASAAMTQSAGSFSATIFGPSTTNAIGALLIAASNEVELKSATSNLTLWATEDMLVHAGKDTAFAFGGLYTEAVTGAATSHYGSFLTVAASNDVSFATNSNMALSSACNLTMTAGKDAKFEGLETLSNVAKTISQQAGNFVGGVDAASNYLFQVGTPTVDGIFKIDSTGVQVTGDLKVVGIIDSVTIEQTTLRVEDKTVKLATNITADGIENDGAGIVIGGDAALPKSIVWKQNGGGELLKAGAAYSNDSYWDVRGGALRISHTHTTATAAAAQAVRSSAAAGQEISFGFRINDKEELELVKKYGNTTTRVAKFGFTKHI